MNTVERNKIGEIYSKFFDPFSEDNLEDVFEYLYFARIITKKQYNKIEIIGDKIWDRMVIEDKSKLKKNKTIRNYGR